MGENISSIEEHFFNKLSSSRGPIETNIARKILEWAKEHSLPFNFQPGTKESYFYVMIQEKNYKRIFIRIRTAGKLEIRFDRLRDIPPFDDKLKRLELLNKLNSIYNFNFPETAINTYPYIYLSVFSNNVLTSLVDTFNWVIAEKKSIGKQLPSLDREKEKARAILDKRSKLESEIDIHKDEEESDLYIKVVPFENYPPATLKIMSSIADDLDHDGLYIRTFPGSYSVTAKSGETVVNISSTHEAAYYIPEAEVAVLFRANYVDKLDLNKVNKNYPTLNLKSSKVARVYKNQKVDFYLTPVDSEDTYFMKRTDILELSRELALMK